jgi:hypothetical protein
MCGLHMPAHGPLAWLGLASLCMQAVKWCMCLHLLSVSYMSQAAGFDIEYTQAAVHNHASCPAPSACMPVAHLQRLPQQCDPELGAQHTPLPRATAPATTSDGRLRWQGGGGRGGSDGVGKGKGDCEGDEEVELNLMAAQVLIVMMEGPQPLADRPKNWRFAM